MVLDAILEETRRRIAALGRRRGELERAAQSAPRAPNWRAALSGADVAVIAEIKRRSPSAGAIAPAADAAALARAYAAGGARAISVLTEAAHFGGSLEDLGAVRRAVEVPLLRKDFVIDPLQVYEARAAGASAVLLIVRILDDQRLFELAALAAELGLARLVEAHDVQEVERALQVSPEAIGVNSRDLATFAVSVRGLKEALAAVPAGTLAVAESGLERREDVERVAGWGADAVLVGAAVAGADDPARAVRALVGVPRRGRPR